MLDTVSSISPKPPKAFHGSLNHIYGRLADKCLVIEFGKEKSESLEGLTDKQIEERVTGLVKTEA